MIVYIKKETDLIGQTFVEIWIFGILFSWKHVMSSSLIAGQKKLQATIEYSVKSGLLRAMLIFGGVQKHANSVVQFPNNLQFSIPIARMLE